MRIVLAYKSHPEGAHDPYTSLLPIGLGYLHAVLVREGYDSLLANYSQTGWGDILRELKDLRPDILGISQFTHNRHESIRLAETAKRANPRCFVILGGPHATHSWNDILNLHPHVDAVVIGEGEETLSELVCRIAAGDSGSLSDIPGLALRQEAKVFRTEPRSPIKRLDDLPRPASAIRGARHVNVRRQMEFVTTSRGCPASCRFCSSPAFWNRHVRFRSPREIVDEITYIRDTFGLIYFSFRDDTFTADKRRVMELCRLLIDEKLYILWNCQSRVASIDEEMLVWMKRAGCECVQVGVESGSRRMLDILDKRITPEQVVSAAAAIRKVGINLSVYLITGVPTEDDEDLAESVRLIQSIRPHDGQVSPLAFYPGTALFADAVKSRDVSADLFESTRAAALPVSSDPFTARSTKRLLAELEKVGRKSRFKEKDFIAQRRLLGYSYVTNIMEGEFHEERGDVEKAEQAYGEIISREPRNPWGWLSLGELCGDAGRYDEAAAAFHRAVELVPFHAPALSALGELELLMGRNGSARKYFSRALDLDPDDETAREGLSATAKK